MPPITPDRWRALSPYLDEALDLQPRARAAWLASLAERDPTLAAELRTLLAQGDAAAKEGFLDGALLDAGAAPPQPDAGQVLGAYRLLSVLGEGGSGRVWLAERCDGRFEGRAAVKLLSPALVARFGEERFRREGSILASLRDSRIAHLIDAGVSVTGQPYLVLEYVDGEPIDRYCDTRGLPTDERLRLFLDVLEAVAHAHANLVVHRDIKPGNVLVRKDGRVKLLDFGIAKLLQQADGGEGPGTESSALTREIGKALTPQYAAPEQLSGGALTTATDVYALGVLLYVLLTGRHPAGEPDSAAGLIRAVLLDDVPRPSAVAPPAARRTLRGDLDAIIGRALEREPRRRYASVTAFADDIRRCLRHEPVSARADTAAYRAARFLRRNAAIVVILTTVAVLVAGLTGLHARRLAAERDRAQRETAKAVKVSEILAGLLTSADPYAARPSAGGPTVRALLDGGSAQVERELAGQPDLQAEILTTMGRTYRRLGVYDRSRRLLEQALAAGHEAFGPEHVRVAHTLHDLGVLFADTGNYDAAAGRLEQALAMRRRLLGSGAPDVAVTLAELGRVLQDMGFNARAEPLHREALEIRRTALGPGDRETAVSLSDLASVRRLAGDVYGARALLEECLMINERTRGEDHPNTAVTRHDLAILAFARGEVMEAEALLRRALAAQREALGARHPVVAGTLNTLARVLGATGRSADAALLLDDALEIVRPALGPDHQLVGIYAINRAALDVARRPAAAEPLLREGLRIRALAPHVVPARRRTVAEDDWSPGAVKSLLGAVLAALGRYAEAEPFLLEARRDLQASPAGRRDADAALTAKRLADLYAVWGRPDVSRF